jgi:two-component system, response regulator PdtaR
MLEGVKNKDIMIVEDENIIALDMKIRLKKLGYNVVSVVRSGEEAIEKAKEVKPDLILMDVLLKGSIDGVEAAEEITNELKIPVIFISAYSDEKTLKRAKKISPYGYLIKPINELEFNERLKYIFKNYSEVKDQSSVSDTLFEIDKSRIGSNFN